MKHLIETANPSGLATVPYDRIVLDSTENDVIVRGGYEYVDLGLPSGLKWAKCNIGAEKETDYGYYFQWGDTVDKSNADCTLESYKYYDGTINKITKYTSTDGKITLEPEDDATTQIMGGKWRMPTQTECQELLDYTNYEKVLNYGDSGVNGWKFTSKTDTSKYIFIPASGYRSGSSFKYQPNVGYLWSSSLTTNFRQNADRLCLQSRLSNANNDPRIYAMPTRGVFK